MDEKPTSEPAGPRQIDWDELYDGGDSRYFGCDSPLNGMSTSAPNSTLMTARGAEVLRQWYCILGGRDSAYLVDEYLKACVMKVFEAMWLTHLQEQASPGEQNQNNETSDQTTP